MGSGMVQVPQGTNTFPRAAYRQANSALPKASKAWYPLKAMKATGSVSSSRKRSRSNPQQPGQKFSYYRRPAGILTGIFMLSLLAGLGFRSLFAAAEDAPPREAEISISVLETQWWLTRWEDNQIECVLTVDHEALPTPNEVFASCGKTLYDEWWATPLCEVGGEGETTTGSCQGLYLHQASQAPAERTVVVELPPATAWLSLSGCDLVPPENRCGQVPELLVTGEEPLPNESIKAVYVALGEEERATEFICEGDTCEVPLPVTTMAGTPVEFWVESTFGDTSEHFTAQVRVLDGGVSDIPGEEKWFVDVISTQWRGGEIASCSQVWESFPPPGGPPAWLMTPDTPEELATDIPFVILAGRLIAQGAIDASSCPGDGLLANGTANTCGLEIARPEVQAWQNRFDANILSVANTTNVPAQLIKNVFAVESQFWPGSLIPQEFGFGQMTELGADTALLWNASFFDEFCPLVLDASACAGGYIRLDKEARGLLRGALTARTDSSCPDCPLGIDLAHAAFSIEVFSETLKANCEQAGRIVRNATGKSAGAVSTYEDLWRFTLVNYNAGPGCLSTAVKTTWQGDRVLDWDHLAPRLDLACPNSVSYVEQVIGREQVIVTPGPTPDTQPYPAPSATPPPSPTPVIYP